MIVTSNGLTRTPKTYTYRIKGMNQALAAFKIRKRVDC